MRRMTTENYSLYKLRQTILEDDKFVLDPITTMQAKMYLEAWYDGMYTEHGCVERLVKIGVIDDVKEKVVR
jgi:hypothetical protein